MRPENDSGLHDRILEAALELGERHGWDALHLYDIASHLGIGLADVHRCYRQKDDIAEAWFDRADQALLAVSAAPAWHELSQRERLFRAIVAWLRPLAPHRHLTAQMLGYKLQPEHVHLQALGVVRISRTVQWIREAARVPSTGLRREIEEIAITTIYLAAFAHWLRDDSPGSRRTHELLDRFLGVAERAATGFGDLLPGSPRRT